MGSTVSMTACDENVLAAVERVLEPFAVVVANCRVLIKPNLHGGPCHTSLSVIRAVALWALSQDAKEIVVGDGPYYGLQAPEAYFEETCVARVCRDLGVQLVCFHSGSFRVVTPKLPALPRTLGLTEWLYWADVVISVPVMKTHYNTLTTLALKNLKGFLRPQDKRALHSFDLHRAIAALGKIIRPDVHILDATVAYEGMGPSSGTPVQMGLLMASTDAFALDTVASWLMGFEPARLRYLMEGQALGLGQLPTCDEEIAKLTNLPMNELIRRRRHFRSPYEAASTAYPGLEISTELACSGCLMNLFTALRELDEEGIASSLRGRVAIGKAVHDADVLLGNCTYSGWDNAEYLSGCPPAISEIKEALRRIVCKP